MTIHRHAQVVGPGEVRIVETTPPEWRTETDILCRVLGVGVCGTDVSLAKSGDVVEGQVLGHEIVAEVTATPAQCWVRPGDRVMIRPLRACESCWYCGSGLPHLCDDSAALTISYGRPGGYADQIVVDAATPGEVVRVAPGVDDLDAVWAEPLAVAVHAVDTARQRGHGELTVIGAGPLGLSAVAAAAALGLTVSVVEPRDARREAALGIGATRAVARGSDDPSLRARQVLVTVGAQPAIDLATELCLPGGLIVHAGLGPAEIPAVSGPVDVTGSFGYLPEDFLTSTELINTGQVRLGTLVSHQVPLADLSSAVRLPLVDADAVKVVVRPRID